MILLSNVFVFDKSIQIQNTNVILVTHKQQQYFILSETWTNSSKTFNSK